MHEIAREASTIKGAESVEVIWDRLKDLSAVSRENGGKLYRSRKGSLGATPPYFVSVFVREGITFAVAESPVYGHATYVVSEAHAPGTWVEVLSLPRARGAKSVGAISIRHSRQAPHGEAHRRKIENVIQDFLRTERLH